jgi:molecular chaperone Hsp33
MKCDGLYHVTLLDGQARALIIDSTRLVEDARVVHGLSKTATAALGRHLTAAAMLGAMIKEADGSVTATVKGDGPLGTLLAVARPDGAVKGYVDAPDVELARVDGKLAVGDAVGRQGRLTVIRDLGFGEPYVGQVNLVSGELAEDYAMYFAASEQVPSLVSLGVLVADRVVSAGGLIVQMLPGASEAAISAVEALAPGLKGISTAMEGIGLDEAVARLLGPVKPQIIGRVDTRYACDCNMERIERALISIGEEELRELIDEPGYAEVGCHFCKKMWHLSGQALTALLEKAR